MSDIEVPVDAAVAFAHAEVQVIAETHAVDLLHIKGPALEDSLRRAWPDEATGTYRHSIDADVLVRPSHVTRLSEALRTHGWRCLFDFADGSAFEHAATWTRDDLSSVDVHRYFPGIERDPEDAFRLLWTTRGEALIAGIACPVPSLTAQRLVLLIHAARGQEARDGADRGRAWSSLDEGDRAEIDRLADDLDARVALRAGTGRLDSVRGERTYLLWRHLAVGDTSPVALWWARVRSAPTVPAAVRLGVRMLVPNRHRVEVHLGRPPSRREMVVAYRDRARYGIQALSGWAQGRRGSQR